MGHEDCIHSVHFSQNNNNNFVVSGSSDKTVRLWHPFSGKQIKAFLGHQDLIYVVQLSSDSRIIVSGSFDKTIRVWESETG